MHAALHHSLLVSAGLAYRIEVLKPDLRTATRLGGGSGAGFHKEPRKKQRRGDDDEEVEEAAGREARWGRIALAATKQSLRWEDYRRDVVF